MKYFPLLLCVMVLGCQPPAPRFQPVKHVLVIGIDGMSPDGIHHASTPIMDQLIREGAFTGRARAVLKTSSSPNWASMIMGAGPERHGITANAWELDRHALPPVTFTSDSRFPTIFSILKAQRPEATTASIYDWTGFGRLYQKSAVDYDVNGKDEYETTHLAVAHLKAAKPTFTFVHLDHVDHAGHEYQHGSPEYYASVEVADSLIGLILDAARAAGMADDMVLILSADHGGKGYGHGGETLAEIEIPFLVYGKGIKAGFPIVDPVFTYDNAATAAFALGLERPYVWTGKPVQSAFTGFESQEPILSMLPPPDIHPTDTELKAKEGVYRAPALSVAMDLFVPGAEIRFTVDETEPTEESLLYQEEIVVTDALILKARAFQAGREPSPVATATFIVE